MHRIHYIHGKSRLATPRVTLKLLPWFRISKTQHTSALKLFLNNDVMERPSLLSLYLTVATSKLHTLFTFLILKDTMSMTVEVRVPNLDCQGCASKLKRALFKLDGVEEVEVEMEMRKVTVRGYGLEEKKVLKAIKRAGKAAEAWPFPGQSSHFAAFYKYPSSIVSHYYDTTSSSANAHTFFHTPALYSRAVASDEAVASLFSDDNPHACAIM